MFSDFIAQRRSEILNRCMLSLKTSHPGRGDEELSEGLTAVIDNVAEALRADVDEISEQRTTEVLESNRQHGTRRKNQGFELNQVIHDYGLVCDSIIAVAADEGVNASPREFQLLNRWIDSAIALAVDSFATGTRVADEKVQAERIGALAHEIRNAANNAALGFELIRSGKVAANGTTAEVVRRALIRIHELADQSLVDARTASQEAAVSFATLHVHDALKRLASETFPERGVIIRTELRQPDVKILANENLLFSALSNLLQNALKFTRDNGAVVLRSFPSKAGVRIEVEDTCGGLPDGATEDLFRAFVQRSHGRGGVGLGLPIAKRAVEAHGGTLSVRNNPGIGCTFVVDLPRTIVH
jgi:signal transduction histidine kinase